MLYAGHASLNQRLPKKNYLTVLLIRSETFNLIKKHNLELMKKTTLNLLALCLLMFVTVSVQAQSAEARAVKQNLVETLENLAFMQSHYPNSQDIPLLIEKRDFLQAQLSQMGITNGAGDDSMLRTGASTDGQQVDANDMYQRKIGAADGRSVATPPSDDAPGMTPGQSVVWNQLVSAEAALARLQKSPDADPAEIAAYQKRIAYLKSNPRGN